MPLVSVTRVHLRSVRFMPLFMLHANRTIAQIRKADGFRAGAVAPDADLAFWTITLWRDERAMQVYVATGAHRTAMPRLADWADEASLVGWIQDRTDLPDWREAARRLREEGRSLAVRHPASDHAGGGFAEPRMSRGMRL